MDLRFKARVLLVDAISVSAAARDDEISRVQVIGDVVGSGCMGCEAQEEEEEENQGLTQCHFFCFLFFYGGFFVQGFGVNEISLVM